MNLGHQNKNYVKKILHKFRIQSDKKEKFCEPCLLGKQCRKPFPTTKKTSTEPGQIGLIHSNVCSRMKECSNRWEPIFYFSCSCVLHMYSIIDTINIFVCLYSLNIVNLNTSLKTTVFVFTRRFMSISSNIKVLI